MPDLGEAVRAIKSALVRLLRASVGVLVALLLAFLIIPAVLIVFPKYSYPPIRDKDRALWMGWAFDWAVIGVDNGPDTVSAILEKDEWDQLISAWNRARTERDGAGWYVETVRETDVDNATVEIASSGPMLRFVLRQGPACTVYGVSAGQEAEIDRELLAARDDWDGKHTGMRSQTSLAQYPSAYISTLRDELHRVLNWPPAPYSTSRAPTCAVAPFPPGQIRTPTD